MAIYGDYDRFTQRRNLFLQKRAMFTLPAITFFVQRRTKDYDYNFFVQLS
jgi:hypothetical protein